MGRYELLGVIGRGGMGVVSRARDLQTGREVAIKRVRGMDDRAHREALAAARLRHPCIVELIDARATDDGWILVSELIDGADLRAVMRAGQIPDLEVARFAGSVVRGLAHAHEHGVVHRDVKPANILCPRDPRRAGAWAKLTDFGVAALQGAETLTAVGDVVGTMAYMAPEQARGHKAGAPADVFALAMVVYEALTGYNPRRGDTPAETAARALMALPPLHESRPDLPHEVLQAVDHCLAVDPAARGDVWTLDQGLRVLAGRPPATGRRAAQTGTRIARGAPQPPAPLPAPVHEPATALHQSPRAVRGEQAWAERIEHARAAEPDPYAPAPPPAPPGRMPRISQRLLGAAGAAAGIAAIAQAVGAPGTVAAAGLLAVLLPRLTWLLLAATAAALLTQTDTGAAGLVAIALVLPVVLLPGRGALWPAAGLAAGLAVIGAPTAWPALAALAPRPALRIVIAVQGALVAAATATATTVPVLDAPPGDLGVLLSTFALPLAVIYAGGAIALGLLVRGRTVGADLAAASLWAGAIGGAMAGAGIADPHLGLWIPGFIAGLVVVGARAVLREQDRARTAPVA